MPKEPLQKDAAEPVQGTTGESTAIQGEYQGKKGKFVLYFTA